MFFFLCTWDLFGWDFSPGWDSESLDSSGVFFSKGAFVIIVTMYVAS